MLRSQADRSQRSDSLPTRGPSVAIIGTRGYPSYYGGFETAVRQLAPALADAGWSVTVYGRAGAVRMDDPDRDPRVQSVETRGIERRSLSTLTFGLTAAWHALRHTPDVALVMNVANGFFLPLLQLRRIPTLVNVDGIEWERAKWGRLAKLVFRCGARLTARHADRIVVDAVEIGRRWREELGRDGSYIPYGGTPAANLPVEPGLRHRGYVLFVARLVPENTVAEFLGAAERIANELPVVIVGSSGYGGELEAAVARLAATHAGVIWLGHVSDDARLHALWQHAAVYVHGHSVGGTNPALVQAMAVGAPVVARDTPYNREVLPQGTSFFDPTPTAIEAAVIELADDPRRQHACSTANALHAAERFSWQAVCESYAHELAALVKADTRAVRVPDGRRAA